MAALFVQPGNLSTALGHVLTSENITGTVSGSNTLSAPANSSHGTFTIANGVTVDGVGLVVGRTGTGAPTGTMTVALMKGATVHASVTVNMADIAFVAGMTGASAKPWHFFKFTTTHTANGDTTYFLRITTSSGASTILVGYPSAATVWFRFLRTTTTQAVTKGDDLLIMGEMTGQGTMTTGTVTVDTPASSTLYTTTFTANASTGQSTLTSVSSTAGLNPGNQLTAAFLNASSLVAIQSISASTILVTATNSNNVTGGTVTAKTGFGYVILGNGGDLSFSSAASQDLLFRVHGDLLVSAGGFLEMGTVASPIPGTSRATLEIGCQSDGNYGLFIGDGGTLVTQGSPRTAGKNVVKTHLNGGHASYQGFFAQASNGSNVLTDVASGMAASYIEHLFANMAVGDAISQYTALTTPSYANIPAGATITALDPVARTITMSANATGTQMITAGSATGMGTNAVVGSKNLRVDDDTGWLAGDVIAVAGTTRTQADAQIAKLTANATANRLAADGFAAAVNTLVYPPTGTGGVLTNIDGSGLTKADVILLTRNVVIKAVMPLYGTYIYMRPWSSCDCDWTEFYWMGVNVVTKRGIEIDASSATQITANPPRRFDYCSLHDFRNGGFYIGGGQSQNLEVRQTVFWNCAATNISTIQIATTVSMPDWLFDNCVIIRQIGTAVAVSLADVGGSVTNFTVASGAGGAFVFGEASAALAGTYSGIEAYNNSGVGINFNAAGVNMSLSNLKIWRNNNPAMNFASAGPDLKFDGLTLFGNNSQNIQVQSSANVTMRNLISASEGNFSTVNGINFPGACSGRFVLTDSVLSAPTTGAGANWTFTGFHSADVNFGANGIGYEVIMSRVALNGTNEVNLQHQMTPAGRVTLLNRDNIDGDHAAWTRQGTITRDATIFRTAAPSERVAPWWMGHYSLSATTAVGSSVLTLATKTENVAVGMPLAMSTTATFAVTPFVTAIDASNRTITVSASAAAAGSSTFYPLERMQSSPRIVAVAAGQTVTPKVYVRASQDNRLSSSEAWSASVWGYTNLAAATPANTIVSNGVTLTKFVEGTQTGSHMMSRSTAAVTPQNETWTLSVFAKAAERSWLYVEDSFNSFRAYFNLATGTVGTITGSGVTAAIQDMGNGVYRCSIRYSSGSSNSVQARFGIASANGTNSYAGTGATIGLYLGGAQLERGTLKGYTPNASTTASIFGYDGIAPRLMMRANTLLGITSDTVIAEATGYTQGEWIELTGTTPAAARDGAFEFYVDCCGMLGHINIDDWSVT